MQNHFFIEYLTDLRYLSEEFFSVTNNFSLMKRQKFNRQFVAWQFYFENFEVLLHKLLQPFSFKAKIQGDQFHNHFCLKSACCVTIICELFRVDWTLTVIFKIELWFWCFNDYFFTISLLMICFNFWKIRWYFWSPNLIWVYL